MNSLKTISTSISASKTLSTSKTLSVLDKYNYPLNKFSNVKLPRKEKLHILEHFGTLDFLRIACLSNKTEHVKLLIGDSRISEDDKLHVFIEALNRGKNEDLIIEMWNLIPLNIEVVYHAVIINGYRKILNLILNSKSDLLCDISSPLDSIELCPHVVDFLVLIMKCKQFKITSQDIVFALMRLSLEKLDNVRVFDLLITDKRLIQKIPISILINVPKTLSKYFFYHKFFYDRLDFQIACRNGIVSSLVVFLKSGYVTSESLSEGIKILKENKHYEQIYLLMLSLDYKNNQNNHQITYPEPHMSQREYKKLLDLLDPYHPLIEDNIEFFLKGDNYFNVL